jgi:hypothetical protein
MAVLAVLIVGLTVNSFLYFGYHPPAVPPAPTTKSTPPADEGTNPSAVPEPTVPEPTGEQEEEGQKLRETTGETAVPSSGAATTASPSATSSASATPSPP